MLLAMNAHDSIPFRILSGEKRATYLEMAFYATPSSSPLEEGRSFVDPAFLIIPH